MKRNWIEIISKDPEKGEGVHHQVDWKTGFIYVCYRDRDGGCMQHYNWELFLIQTIIQDSNRNRDMSFEMAGLSVWSEIILYRNRISNVWVSCKTDFNIKPTHKSNSWDV